MSTDATPQERIRKWYGNQYYAVAAGPSAFSFVTAA